VELYVSADYGKTWIFVRLLNHHNRERLPQAFFKAGYSTRVLYPLDEDYFEFRAKAIALACPSERIALSKFSYF